MSVRTYKYVCVYTGKTVNSLVHFQDSLWTYGPCLESLDPSEISSLSFEKFTPPTPPLTPLTPVELDFLTSHSSAALNAFEKVSDSGAAGEKVLALAGSQVASAQK